MYDMQKLILVEAVENTYDCYECGGGYSEPHITQLDSLTQMVERLATAIAQDHGAMQALLKNEYMRKKLDELGFRDVERIKEIEEKATAQKRFYICEPLSRGYGQTIREVDIDNLTRSDAERLASEKTVLLQSISKPSLRKINSGAHRQMTNAKKRNEASAKARKEKAAKRAETKKQKEIEAAKKLLQEEGQL